jgi:hypothetical protein
VSQRNPDLELLEKEWRGIMTEPAKQKAYIAGPMTGYEFYNVVAFMRARRDWEAAGYEVVTPFEANSRVWRRHYDRDFDPFRDRCDYGDPILAEMFAEDVKELLSADVVVLLPGFERSKGVGMEVMLANAFGKQFICGETGRTLRIDTDTSMERAA